MDRLDRFASPLLLVGCGAMAGAMLMRWLDCGLPPGLVRVVRPSGRAVAPGIAVLRTMPADAGAGLVLLGMKPHQLDDVAATLAPLVGEPCGIVSILAGVDRTTLAGRFPAAGAIVRAMPNLPVRTGDGVVALHGPAEDRSGPVETLMRPLGLVEWIGEEARFDAVTALAGSGPAFLYRFIDALAAGGRSLGMDAGQAERLAVATVAGAARLARDAGLPPAALADRVASKGGSTRAGLDVLDRDGALNGLVRETLAAAKRRNAEMGRAARDAAVSPGSGA